MTQTSKLLFDERIVAIQPSLVRALGSVTEAAVLQQIHFHAQAGHVQGDGWVARTYVELGSEIGLTDRQVERAAKQLVAAGAIEASQPEGYVRRKWYRVLYGSPVLSDSSNRANAGFEARELGFPIAQTRVTSLQSSKKELEGTVNGASAVPDTRIQELVAGYVEDYESERDGHSPPPRWRAAAGKAAKEALAAGESPKDIAGCFYVIAHEGKNPGSLNYVLADSHAGRERRIK